MPPKARKLVDKPSEQPLSEGVAIPMKATRKPPVLDPSQSGLGSNAYNDATLNEWFTQPLASKQQLGRNTWANTALVLALRAKRASQTYGKKDFNSLYRLVLSAGIAYDKAWPTVQAAVTGNLVVQLFGSLGSDVARRILEPARPTIINDAIEVTPVIPTGKPVEDNQ